MRPPLDLRLVAPALTLWAACLVVLTCQASPGAVVLASVVLLTLVGVAGGVVVRSRARGPTPSFARPRSRAWPAAVAVGAAAAVGGTTTALELADRGSSAVAALARQRAVVEIEGRVTGDVHPLRGVPTGEDGGQQHRFELAVRAIEGRGTRVEGPARVLVRGGGELAALRDGAVVVLSGRLEPPDPLRPAAATLRGARLVAVLDGPQGVAAATGRVRSALADVVEHLPPDLSGLVVGAAVGDTRGIPDDLVEAMRTSGLAHVTAVSGAHVAVLQLAVAAAAAAGGVRRRPAVVVTAVVLGAFVLLVRPEPSVLRAAVMGAVVLAAGWRGRRAQPVPALAGSVLLLLLVDPWLAVSLGFALSVAATAAIVLLAPPLAAALTPPRVPARLGEVLAVPLAAQAACAPLLLSIEPTLSLWAVPANALAAPALPPATLLGVATAALAPWWPSAAHVLAAAAAAPAWWIGLVARWFAGLPGAQAPWREGTAGVVLLVGITAVLVALAFLVGRVRRDPRRLRGPLPLALVAALVVLAGAVPEVRGAVRGMLPAAPVREDWLVVACDVGQGDALVVRSGERSAVLVDVGPPGDAAARCLDRLGVVQVDLLVLTHHHTDHDGGLSEVLRRVDVERALLPPPANERDMAGRTHRLLRDSGATVEIGQAGMEGAAGQTVWRVLWPSAGDVGRGEDAVNDASLVLAVQVGRTTVVGLGDLGAQAQDRLAARLPRPHEEERAVDVVKMAHHGSADQSATLARLLRPRTVVVSAGRENPYGHPTDSAVQLYEAVGSVVRSTHRCGDVVLVGALDVADEPAATPDTVAAPCELEADG